MNERLLKEESRSRKLNIYGTESIIYEEKYIKKLNAFSYVLVGIKLYFTSSLTDPSFEHPQNYFISSGIWNNLPKSAEIVISSLDPFHGYYWDLIRIEKQHIIVKGINISECRDYV